MKRCYRFLVAVVLAVAFTSCAEVTVRKVGDPTGETGMRFYLPRPYVAVNEPFVVGGEAYLVGGELTPDGKYVLITDVVMPSGGEHRRFLERFLAGQGRRIPATRVLVPPDGDETAESAARGRAGREPGLTDPVQPGDAEGVRENDPAAGPARTGGGPTGVSDLSVSNDNNAFAITPLKRYFDIVWLPDFDEQYVVHGESGLGNTSIALQMGQGWSLQGLDATVDNSALADRVLGLIDHGTDVLSAFGRAQLGLPTLTMGSERGGGGARVAGAQFAGGTPLTLKVTFVRIAAPGLYPILKPKEMAALGTPTGELADRLLIPVAPYTNIAFNTYEAVVVEAALATGDSALRLHQYLDLTSPGAGRSATPSR